MKLKTILGFLGMFLVVGGLGAGIILTQQQQLLAPKAASINNCTDKKGNSKCKSGKETCVNGVCKPINNTGGTNTSGTGGSGSLPACTASEVDCVLVSSNLSLKGGVKCTKTYSNGSKVNNICCPSGQKIRGSYTPGYYCQ